MYVFVGDMGCVIARNGAGSGRWHDEAISSVIPARRRLCHSELAKNPGYGKSVEHNLRRGVIIPTKR